MEYELTKEGDYFRKNALILKNLQKNRECRRNKY